MIYIGIDPGKHTGIAVWDRKKLELHTFSFWEAVRFLERKFYQCQALKIKLRVVLEDPTQNKPLFEKKGVANNVALLKIAQNVGQNKRDAQLLHEFMEIQKIEVLLVKPETKKWGEKYFKTITNYEGKYSQHSIDAAKLVYGK